MPQLELRALTGAQNSALFHFGYEWWMFRCMQDCALMVASAADDDPVRNAILETLIGHGRVLIDAFYNRPKGLSKTGDWNASTFGVPLQDQVPDALCTWRVNADKRLAHLTDTRALRLNEWPLTEVSRTLKEQMDSLLRHIGTAWPECWPDRFQRTATNLLSVPREQSGSAMGATGPAGQ